MMKIPGTLLVVDDEPKIRKVLREFFTSRGMRVIEASSGEEALAAISQPPSAVLLDVKIPGLDGVATLQRLRQRYPKLPIIMVSAVEEEPTVRQALDAGAYDYVMKPFNLEYLETVVLTKVLLGMEG